MTQSPSIEALLYTEHVTAPELRERLAAAEHSQAVTWELLERAYAVLHEVCAQGLMLFGAPDADDLFLDICEAGGAAHMEACRLARAGGPDILIKGTHQISGEFWYGCRAELPDGYIETEPTAEGPK